ncbi:MAG: glycosyltransferase [Thermoleophilia bacterium]
MRVLFLQRQPCIRTLKYAIGLRGRGADVTLGFAYQGRTLTEWYGSGDDLFEAWWQLAADDPASGLAAALAEFRPDVIHSHNLPDSLTVLALEVTGGRIPVIHDSHDLQSLRSTPYEDGFDDPEDPEELESEAVEGCAALVAVSQEMLDAIAARHRLPERTLLFANYALARDLTSAPQRGRRYGESLRVVYQGSLSTNGSHYDLRDGFAALAAADLDLDVFPNRDAPAYRELAMGTRGMRLMDRLEPEVLLRRLPAYDVGWAVFNPRLNAAHLDTALPNKAFEYLASGIPIAAGPHAALRRLVEENGVGVVVEQLAALPGVLLDAPLTEIRARTLDMRSQFTVEGHVGELVDLYSEVAAIPVRV